uniref:SH3 domain-containing protein n=1 Tax=Caldilinea aerophila TaxID=133453 RepID=A0A7C1FWM4_9CHLR
MSTYTPSQEFDYDDPSSPLIQGTDSPLDAHCYELSDDTGEKVALLTLFLDAQKRVRRAELSYYHRSQLSEALQAAVYREARHIIETRYIGSDGISSTLQVLDSTRLGEERISHNNPDPLYGPERRYPLFSFVIGYTAVVIVLIIFGLINSFAFPASPADSASKDASTGLAEQTQPAEGLSGTAIQEEPTVPLFPPNTNGLLPSKMADNRLAFGMTVRIRPGLRSFVRSEPGPEAGEPVGFLEDGATAKILGGPVWMQGREDTIVWWYVETENGVRGWTPANTSDLTLLEPIE